MANPATELWDKVKRSVLPAGSAALATLGRWAQSFSTSFLVDDKKTNKKKKEASINNPNLDKRNVENVDKNNTESSLNKKNADILNQFQSIEKKEQEEIQKNAYASSNIYSPGFDTQRFLEINAQRFGKKPLKPEYGIKFVSEEISITMFDKVKTTPTTSEPEDSSQPKPKNTPHTPKKK